MNNYRPGSPKHARGTSTSPGQTHAISTQKLCKNCGVIPSRLATLPHRASSLNLQEVLSNKGRGLSISLAIFSTKHITKTQGITQNKKWCRRSLLRVNSKRSQHGYHGLHGVVRPTVCSRRRERPQVNRMWQVLVIAALLYLSLSLCVCMCMCECVHVLTLVALKCEPQMKGVVDMLQNPGSVNWDVCKHLINIVTNMR